MPPPAGQVDAIADRALARVLPALVNLNVVAQRYAEGRAQRFQAAGSGVVVTPEGHVLTNFHVAGEATRIRGTLATGEVLEADVIVHDPATDLSVLRLRPKGPRSFPCAELGTSIGLSVGDSVLAMGNPFALASSVTLGIVSNPRRVFTDPAGSELVPVDLGAGEATGTLTPWIQHDALILPGNSGGPLVDLEGRVVGINELGGAGMGFAIPAEVAAEVLRQALARGEVRRSWIGLTVLPVQKLGRSDAALVSAVVPDSPAARAGIAPGDLIRSLSGEPVAVRFFEEVPAFYQRVAAIPVGRQVELRIERDGKALTVTLRTEPLERSRGAEGEFRALGLTAQEITGPMVLAATLAGKDGLLVTGLRAGAPAARARPELRAGDVLVALDRRPLSRLADLQAALASRRGGAVLLELRRGRESLLATTELEQPREPQWGGELPRAWLGARTQVLTPDLATAIGLEDRRGFRVTEVFPGTAASRAGLLAGDLLITLDGEPLSAARVQESEVLRRLLEERPLGSRARFGVLRGEAAKVVESVIEVELEPEPVDPGEARRERDDEIELAARDLTLFDRLRLRLEASQRGALVVETAPGGWAQVAGVRPDDLVLEVAGREVTGAESLAHELSVERAARPCVVELFIRRGALTQFLFVEPVRPGEPCREPNSLPPSSPSN